MRPRTSSSINMHDRHPKKLIRDILTQYSIIFTKDINKAQRSGASRSAIIADQDIVSIPPEVEEAQEPTLRRTLLNIMHRNSSIEYSEGYESPPTSPRVVISHHSITLYDDPDHSEPTPKQSGTCTPQDNHQLPDDDDRVDAERLSTDLSLMLGMEDQDDAVEIADREEVDRRRISPTGERPPTRSRASTKGTMDNVVLDSFFDF
jgi:hypothetical protein